jgi:hypothetical protein
MHALRRAHHHGCSVHRTAARLYNLSVDEFLCLTLWPSRKPRQPMGSDLQYLNSRLKARFVIDCSRTPNLRVRFVQVGVYGGC